MNVNLTPLLKVLIAILATLAMYHIVPWIKSKTTAAQREELLKWADIAVAAAQQLYYTADGPDRLAYAMEFLADKGYDVDAQEIRDTVEAAVLKLHQQLEEV